MKLTQEKLIGIIAGCLGVVVIPTCALIAYFVSVSNQSVFIDNYVPTDSQDILVSYTNENGAEHFLKVEIADELHEQQQGLMHRTQLPEDAGMLFVFEQERELSFWMKNTLIPLDIIFLDKNLRVVSIHEDTEPNQTSTIYYSRLPAQYALEVNAGWSEKAKLEVGDQIKILNFDSVSVQEI